MNNDEIQGSSDYVIFCKERRLDCDCPDSEFEYIDYNNINEDNKITKNLNSKYKHILKTISYRIFSTITTFSLIFLFTRNVALGIGISTTDLIIKSFLYYIHERVWHKRMEKKNE